MRSRGLLWLTASFVATAGFWIFGHRGGSSAPSATGARAALCRDVGNLTQSMVRLRAAGTTTGPNPSELASFQAAFDRDAGALGDAGDPEAGAAASDLAQDLGQWRDAVAAGDPVQEDIAVNRTLSALASLPGC